ncbi:MAG: hypothetical protein ACI88C_002908 [Acidimicrobiales bacterium]|jgi:hypothetical protein
MTANNEQAAVDETSALQEAAELEKSVGDLGIEIKGADICFGDDSRCTEVFEANKPLLSDPDPTLPGQGLGC